MKNIFLTAALFVTVMLQAQDKHEIIKSFITDQVLSSSVPFAHGKGTKVSRIEFGKDDQVTLHYLPYKKPESFKLHELYKETNSSSGVELYEDNRFIQFHLTEERTRIISFGSYAVALKVYEAFLQLLSPDVSATGSHMYFISKTAQLSSSNEQLLKVIRCTDKMDAGDSTIRINSRGEGWVDKDSVPIGHWKFYATNNKGKEYLFKEGEYMKTDSSVFMIIGVDTDEVKQRYHMNLDELKKDYVSTVPFMKTLEWKYYHDNGNEWKKVFYKFDLVPLELAESMDPSTEKNSLVVKMPETFDEYITGEVAEFNKKGICFKKLEYDELGFLMTKTLISPNGSVTRKETAEAYGPVLLPNNN
ncbi:MAG: hypothetical protein ACJ75F_07395 [Flavisolibacter sp.]